MNKRNPPIQLSDGSYVNYVDIRSDIFKDKSINVLGGSNTGKSYILNEMINGMCKYIWIVIVFASTADIDNSFCMDEYTSRLLIYEDINTDALLEITAIAKERKKLFIKSRSLPSLEASMKICLQILMERDDQTKLKSLKSKYKKIKKKERTITNSLSKDERSKLIKDISDMYRYCLINMHNYIYDNNINVSQYDDESLLSLVCVKMNTHLGIIFNDLGPTIGNLGKKDSEILTNLLIKGRHSDITFISLGHAITHLPAGGRKSCKVFIFTDETLVGAFLHDMKIKGKRSAKIMEAAERVIGDDSKKPENKRKYTKLVYFTETGKMYYIIADNKCVPRRCGDKRILKHLDKFVKNNLF